MIGGIVWIGSTAILVCLGLILVRGLEWIRGPINFHLFGSHGFETQDAMALPFLLAGVGCFCWGLWLRRAAIEASIRRSPLTAFVVALCIGLVLGGFVGLVAGAAFDDVVKAALKILIKPVDWLSSPIRQHR
jgi:branched-subunit amino acid ABC-type transport system permease component